MEQRPTDELPQTTAAAEQLQAAMPAPARAATVDRSTVDPFPTDAAEWAKLAALPAADRAAVYLKSIRTMMIFFTILAVTGIIAGVILAIIDIHSISQAQQPQVPTNPFG